MAPYVPLHDRSPYFSNLPTPPYSRDPPTPRYASPDYDPSLPLHPGSQLDMSSTSTPDYHNEYNTNNGSSTYAPRSTEGEAGPSRKRARPEEYTDHHIQQYHNAGPVRLTGSIFNIAPRNPFTAVVGDFIMANAAGLDNVEIEIKLGILMSPDHQGNPQRRIRMPTQSEMIVPPDYPLGPFHATMHPYQHKVLNNLLNQAAQQSVSLPPEQGRVNFSRSKLTDSFHGQGGRGGKIRVSRSRETGEVVEVVKKRRIADMNVFCPGAAFDWRISVNVEEPYDMPDSPPTMTRDKDRASYRHQVCQVDLTHVMSKENAQAKAVSSFELEIELLDVPTLLAEGQAQSDRFDEILQNALDTARMLVKNCDPAPQ
ncbi:uncharacterized protein I206_101411 [Kwoniella pini CBS 10737]|uniref:mRNA-capping enzyme subunit beta n=1 Tax=Kwoniella pini CBS 10737 TaxID=1296096 RepID=A0A1B9HWR0_9TREE|nr:uncharacterized protein I206_06619 [Kwoniella pini CBS 10737]OCF47713.1 hypothetical protein I206_06619 [Kwoniella pini CBS 10737]